MPERIAESRTDLFVQRYGETVNKMHAGLILGVTYQTIFRMLADGRIRAACGGRRVDVRSIAEYISDQGSIEHGRRRAKVMKKNHSHYAI